MLKNKSTYCVITFATMFAVQSALAANTTPPPKQVVADYTRPLSFEPNRGQADKQADFLAHGTGYGLFLSHADAVMVFEHRTAVRMRPIGANASSQPEPLDPQPSKSNYFIGNVPERWHTNVPNYAKVRYRSVYPGIDLIYYGNQRQLEYDFVLAPGADPDKILLDFQGASKANLNREGKVVMHTTAGDLRWHKPVAYQEVNGSRKLIECSYVHKEAHRVGFKLAAYDRTKPLIIDPVLEYSTYLGGSGEDFGSRIAVDVRGNAYVIGSTISNDFPTKDAFQNNFNITTGDAFITKFCASGELVYSTYLGGSGGDGGGGIAVDRDGFIYVTGVTTSIDFPIKNAFQDKLNGVRNAFVTKFNADGDSLVYSTYLGGSGGASGTAVALDVNGNAYITGDAGPGFPIQNAFQDNPKGPLENPFVTKLNPNGDALVYSTYLGGTGLNQGNGIAVDTQGNAYVAGSTNSTDFPTKNAFQPQFNSHSGAMAFVTKFDADGNLVYSTYLGGSVFESGYGIAVDREGSAYVTGFAGSPDFPTKNAFQNKMFPSGNAFVTKFAPNGESLVYSTYLGGSGQLNGPCPFIDETGQAIAVNARGEAYITGVTWSPDFPIKSAFQGTLKSCRNTFATKLDADGDSLVYSSYLGGSGTWNSSNGIAVDKHGNAYIVGTTNSSDFPTKNAFQPVYGGNFDAFVTKISAH